MGQAPSMLEQQMVAKLTTHHTHGEALSLGLGMLT